MLADKIVKCQQCPLSANIPYGCTPMVGIGNPDARLVIVVPHPKLDCILIQSPLEFTYRFYLEKLLKEIAISKDDYYVTCIVKCPTETASPKIAELKSCSSFLLQEIKGKIVVGCGESVCKMLKKINVDHIPIPNLNKLLQSSRLKEEQILDEIRARLFDR